MRGLRIGLGFSPSPPRRARERRAGAALGRLGRLGHATQVCQRAAGQRAAGGGHGGAEAGARLELGLHRREHVLVGHRLHARPQRPARRPRAPARARPVDDARQQGEEQPGGDAAEEQQRGQREALHVRRGDDVAELQVAEHRERGEPQRARRGRPRPLRAAAAPARAPPARAGAGRGPCPPRPPPAGRACAPPRRQGGRAQQAGPRLGQPLPPRGRRPPARPRPPGRAAPASAGGSEARSPGALPGSTRSGSRRRRSGSGRSRRSQRPYGQPAASAPRRRCARSTARTTPGTPAACSSASTSAARSRASDAALPRLARRSRRPGARPRRSRRRRAGWRPPRAGRRARPARTRSAPRPSCVRADTASTGTPGSPSRSSSAPRSARQASRSAGVEAVGLVEHDEHRLAVAGERPQVVLVQRGVRVLLRVHDPHHEVGERDHAVHLEAVLAHDRVEVGQVEQHEPVELLAAMRWRRGTSSQSSSASSDRAPDGRARGRRRRPAVAGRGELGAGEGVEQRRLPRAGRAGQGDHGGLDAQPEALAGAPHDGLARRPRRRRRAARGQLRRLRERRQAAVERAVGRPPAARRGARRAPPRPLTAPPRRARSASRRRASRGASAGRARAGRAARGSGRPPPAISRSTRSISRSRARAASERTAWSPKMASSTFWPSADVPPATTTSAPVSPPVLAKTAIITVRPGAVDAEGGEPRGRPLAGPLLPHELEHLALPGAHLLGGVRPRSVADAASSRRPSASSGRPAGCPRHAAAARSAARSAAAPTTASTPLCTAVLSSHVGRRGARDEAAQPVAQPADARLQRAHQVARAHDVVPAREHLAAQQRAAADRVVDLGDRGGVRAVDRLAQHGRGLQLLRQRGLDGRGAPRQALQRAGQRPPHELRRAPARRRRGRRATARTGRERRRREPAGLERASPAPRAAACRGSPCSASMPSRCGPDVVRGLLRHAVEHDGQRGAAVAGGVQQVPRHGVGVAGRGGHEQPGVGGGEELGGERAVGLHHRVDVRRVEQRQARREAVGRAQRGGRRAGRRRRSCARGRAGCGRPRTTGRPPGGRRAPARGSSGAARRPCSPPRRRGS